MNSANPESATGRPAASAFAAGLALAMPIVVMADQAVLHMEIGDPARKAVRSRSFWMALPIPPPATGRHRKKWRSGRRTGILFIGENHTNQEFHDVQFRTIRPCGGRARSADRSRDVPVHGFAAGARQLECRRYTENGFVELGGWYDSWGYHWNYYRNIFLYARENGINFYAVNSPRDVVKSVRAKGFANLTPEEAAHLPPKLDGNDDEHRCMYRAFFDKDDALHMNEAALDGLYRAQTMWDATMGWNAVQALKQHGGPNAIMVVLIGAGHVTSGWLGAADRRPLRRKDFLAGPADRGG